MNDALLNTIAFGFAMAACWFALAGAVRLQKWWDYERTRKLQERQYLAYMKQQQRPTARKGTDTWHERA